MLFWISAHWPSLKVFDCAESELAQIAATAEMYRKVINFFIVSGLNYILQI